MTSLRCGAVLGCVALLAACDESQVLHEPTPGLERMLAQRRGRPYAASSTFADGRLMREPPPGAVPREHSVHSTALATSQGDDPRDAGGLPLPVTRVLLQRGHAAFERMCATCHGVLGDGNSVVAEKMELRRPPSLLEARIAALPPDTVFEVVSAGYGLMPGFAAALDADQRWGVVAYLDALQLSQSVSVAVLPPQFRRELSEAAP